MANLKRGMVVEGGSRGKATDWKGVVVHVDGSTLRILNPGASMFSPDGRFLQRLIGAAPEWAHIESVLKGTFAPHGLTATPVGEPKASGSAVDSALAEFLNAIAPGSGTDLFRTRTDSIPYLDGDFSAMEMATTSSGLRIDINVSEFESRDMVQIEHSWRWAVLYQPFVVAGVYRGDRGKCAQAIHESPLPAGAVESLFSRLGAR